MVVEKLDHLLILANMTEIEASLRNSNRRFWASWHHWNTRI